MNRGKTGSMILCALFAALIAVGAFIRIPLPVVPLTLQVEFVLLAGLLLGSRRGLAAVLLYIAMGLVGLPVFTAGGGFSYVLKPSFGFIIGFAAAAYAAGAIADCAEKPGYKRLLAASFAGLFCIYLIGTVYFYLLCNLYLGTPTGVKATLMSCVALPLPGDIVLSMLGAALAKRLLPVVRKSKS